MEDGQSRARTLLFDVESFPNIGYTWGKWEQNVIEFIQEKKIVSFAWKWLGKPEIKCLALPMFKEYKIDKNNNKPLIEKLHLLISSADIVVAHNVDKFDDRMANSDFLIHGLPPPPPHKTVDTLKVAKSKFAFNSNKLDDLGERLGLGRKLPTGGFSLWKGCMDGDPKSWRTMIEYNKQDVGLLEKIYLKMRPWITNHPIVYIKSDIVQCRVCGGRDMRRRGTQFTRNFKKQRFSCYDCGTWDAIRLIEK